MKKTGNLNFLFSKSNAPFFVVFDADFVPDSNFLKITIPLIVEDDKIAILQTPQGFYKSDNNFEQAASDSQIDFYRIIQNSRNYFGGSVCVGTNAVYRRSSISDSKVYEWLIKNKIDHGEDVNTGFYLLDKGYKVEYLPVFLALGNSASNIPSLIKQRNRWASSSTRMFLSGIVYKSKITLMQKISFYSGFMYYITDSLRFSLSYMLFFVLFFHGQELQFVNAVWFFPHIIFGFIILPIFRKNKFNLEPKVVDLLLVYTNMYTFIKRLFGVGANWVPTANVPHTDEVVLKIKKLVYFNFALFYIITLIMTFMNKIPYNNIQAYTVIFWIYYFVITHLILINYLNNKKYFKSNKL